MRSHFGSHLGEERLSWITFKLEKRARQIPLSQWWRGVFFKEFRVDLLNRDAVFVKTARHEEVAKVAGSVICDDKPISREFCSVSVSELFQSGLAFRI